MSKTQAQSHPAGLQAAFTKDAGTLSDKFTGLARVMSGKYDWKPAQGVRSVADVFNQDAGVADYSVNACLRPRGICRGCQKDRRKCPGERRQGAGAFGD